MGAYKRVITANTRAEGEMSHVFFDDQKRHADAALKAGTVTCPAPSSNTEWEFIHWSHELIIS